MIKLSMVNREKAKLIYSEASNALDSLFRGNYRSGLESSISRIPGLVAGGHLPISEIYPSHNRAKELFKEIIDYSKIRNNRREKKIAGGKRHVLTEDDVLNSLNITSSLIFNLVIEKFRRKTDFSNSLFNDSFNLGLAYLHSIVNAVADEYIDPEHVVDSKNNAVNLAKDGIILSDKYRSVQNLSELKKNADKFEKSVSETDNGLVREFELTPVSQKRIYKGKFFMNKISEELTSNPNGEPEFLPEIIFPVAQGGNELGLRIAISYEEKGHSPLVYPLLYSIKTRKHKRPWVENDFYFLGRNLEGKNLLVTEDWVTTGNTLRGILNNLENTFPREIKIATIKRDLEKSRVPLLDKYNFYVGAFSRYRGNKTDSISERNRK